MSILLNGVPIDLNHKFQDGTYSLRLDQNALTNALKYGAVLDWRYCGEHELSALVYIARHMRDVGCKDVELNMPYIPNARMDRVKNDREVFTLKYFAEIINDIGFDSVTVLDPHSNVSCALLDRVVVLQPTQFIQAAIDNVIKLEGAVPLMFYPDEGAMKRYSGLIKSPYAFGIKKRDWETGKIMSFEIHGNNPASRSILMVDDICSKGVTFYHSAIALKKADASHIYIYVTHCEKTLFDGELMKGSLIEHLFTTDSVFQHNSSNNERVTVFRL